MLRMSQSLLTTALGRVEEPFLLPTPTALFPPPTRPARLLSWFPNAPAAPFGVHRMALAGKAAGKDVGMWFWAQCCGGVENPRRSIPHRRPRLLRRHRRHSVPNRRLRRLALAHRRLLRVVRRVGLLARFARARIVVRTQ
ncbi:hypothetical protein B0H13DRAFT_882906 [Mycena leptocephala]|nr:hypothetical protein B0H13DRAFT_882906 [Mycena leptocephala]